VALCGSSFGILPVSAFDLEICGGILVGGSTLSLEVMATGRYRLPAAAAVAAC
jgi:hypothetical protein